MRTSPPSTSPASIIQVGLFPRGPFDALIEFPNGLDVYWMGSKIANLILPNICSAGETSVPDLRLTAILQITDEDAFVSFAAYILLNPSFTWTVSTNTLR